ncbi:TetR/AcrR family transcriptional regulator [Nocardioides mangrovicus]|uniref:TetR/AcrR family transcriptional regulator n=1 Tax=Nocardioides mangrovicus TaxID=2478913 RepID=A0A3L8P0B8_9ACTN|nr:TetR/AcrR family transcriptional regulator [Nocardioides mangrovicus]RLV48451.1 TetR/AcrR family transcriptional regulator [Nocardioides mangrovicus]
MATRKSTQTRLLDAADELLFTDGVLATPVDAVLARAGVSPATLYRAYGSKDGLVAAALERRQRDWLAVWDRLADAADDDRSRLLSVFDALDHFRDRPHLARWCAFLGTAAEYAHAPPVVAAAIRQDTDAMRERLSAFAGPLAGARAAALAEQLLLIVSGDLAMRLRATTLTDSRAARSVAAAVIAAFEQDGVDSTPG